MKKPMSKTMKAVIELQKALGPSYRIRKQNPRYVRVRPNPESAGFYQLRGETAYIVSRDGRKVATLAATSRAIETFRKGFIIGQNRGFALCGAADLSPTREEA